MIGQIQVTLGTGATQVSSTSIPVCWVRIEGDDGNSNPIFVGTSGVTTANGQRIHNSATVPEDLVLGPFATNYVDLNELYLIGTNGEKANVFYVQN